MRPLIHRELGRPSELDVEIRGAAPEEAQAQPETSIVR